MLIVSLAAVMAPLANVVIGDDVLRAGPSRLGPGRGFPLDYDELERWTRVGYEPG
jgi:hypothetical protein